MRTERFPKQNRFGIVFVTKTDSGIGVVTKLYVYFVSRAFAWAETGIDGSSVPAKHIVIDLGVGILSEYHIPSEPIEAILFDDQRSRKQEPHCKEDVHDQHQKEDGNPPHVGSIMAD